MKPIQQQQPIFTSCQPSDGRRLNLCRDNNQAGDLPVKSMMAGTDALTDKPCEKEARLAVLDGLAAEGQQLKLGY
jgi:hypothetical protein